MEQCSFVAFPLSYIFFLFFKEGEVKTPQIVADFDNLCLSHFSRAATTGLFLFVFSHWTGHLDKKKKNIAQIHVSLLIMLPNPWIICMNFQNLLVKVLFYEIKRQAKPFKIIGMKFLHGLLSVWCSLRQMNTTFFTLVVKILNLSWKCEVKPKSVTFLVL